MLIRGVAADRQKSKKGWHYKLAGAGLGDRVQQ